MDADQAVEAALEAKKHRGVEQSRLQLLDTYLDPPEQHWRPSWLPASAPAELKELARICRVPILPFIVEATVQSLYVDGYARAKETDNLPAWDAWQANAMDARQVAVHRGAVSYGTSYVTVAPGDRVPAMRGASPKRLTAVYGLDDRWPQYALEEVPTADGQPKLWRLWDPDMVHTLIEGDRGLQHVVAAPHQFGVTPVVRYQPTATLDGVSLGDVQPLLDLQDQINLTTFSLKVAEHYGAHRQRWIIGWLADSEAQALKTAASTLWQFDPGTGEEARDIRVGEFAQTDLDGYLESREATLRHVATISQTPVHELLGSLANLSAEALVAARDSHNRKLAERQVVLGESHEQTLGLAGEALGQAWDPAAAVRWRDMEARSLSQTADALGKLAEMLNVPVEALWERIPGVTQDEIARWREMTAAGDPLASLDALMGRQTDNAGA